MGKVFFSMIARIIKNRMSLPSPKILIKKIPIVEEQLEIATYHYEGEIPFLYLIASLIPVLITQ